MSIFKKVIFSSKRFNHSVIKNSLLAGTVLLSTVAQDVTATYDFSFAITS